jgi:Domain of unknown function (DUF3883)
VTDGIDASREGIEWTAGEAAVLVGSYFLMLAEEWAGRDYNKSEYRRSVIAAIGRKPGSIERKLQNVSAILDEIGIPWIQGYKPLAHYQDSLVAVVEEHLLQHPELFAAPGGSPPPFRKAEDLLVAPPPRLDSDPASRPAPIRRLIGKFDPAARDARNRVLGRAGEAFVVDFERHRLAGVGREDLAANVRWVSEVDGDGYGYDVQSFEADGAERLLEVKTTCGNERTPFWLTKRECDVAAEKRDIYRVRRVYHFRNEVRMYDIVPPLETRLLLTPTVFMAVPA